MVLLRSWYVEFTRWGMFMNMQSAQAVKARYFRNVEFIMSCSRSTYFYRFYDSSYCSRLNTPTSICKRKVMIKYLHFCIDGKHFKLACLANKKYRSFNSNLSEKWKGWIIKEQLDGAVVQTVTCDRSRYLTVLSPLWIQTSVIFCFQIALRLKLRLKT